LQRRVAALVRIDVVASTRLAAPNPDGAERARRQVEDDKDFNSEPLVRAEVVQVAVLVLFQPAERAAAALVCNLRQALPKIVLVQPGVAPIQVSTRFGAHDVGTVVTI
jgi:hypothetical protein